MTDDEIMRVMAEAVCGIDLPETYYSEVREGLAALRTAGFIITRAPVYDQAVRAAVLEEAARDVEGMARNGRSLPSELAASIRSLINVRDRTPSAQPEAAEPQVASVAFCRCDYAIPVTERDGRMLCDRCRNPLSEAQAGSDTSGPGDRELHRAYLRLRSIIPGAYDTPYAPTPEQVWDVTEKAARALIARLAAADAMAEALEAINAVACVNVRLGRGFSPSGAEGALELSSKALAAYRAACTTDKRPDAEAGTREGGRV